MGGTGDNLKDTLFGTFNQKMMAMFERHLDQCSNFSSYIELGIKRGGELSNNGELVYLHISMNHINSFDLRIRLELGIGSQLLRYCFEGRSNKFSNVYLKVVVNLSNSLVESLHFLPKCGWYNKNCVRGVQENLQLC